MKKILIVEDEAHQRLLYDHILANEGYDIATAANYDEAIDLVGRNAFDLAVVDLKLEEETGLNAIQEILTINKETKIVIHTSYSEYKQDMQAWSADAYIVKSSDTDELIKAIHNLLDE